MYLNRIAGQAQDFVFELLAYKVDDLLSSLWLQSFEPQVMPRGCHSEVEELVDFLSVTFMGLTYLPPSARETAHFTCCTRIAGAMLNHLLSPRVPRLTVLGFVVLDLDLRHMMNFADTCGMPHLRHCFADLNELCQLMLSSQLVALVDNPAERARKFSRVDTNKLAIVMDKVCSTMRICIYALISFHVDWMTRWPRLRMLGTALCTTRTLSRTWPRN
jgi:hypothetical protein